MVSEKRNRAPEVSTQSSLFLPGISAAVFCAGGDGRFSKVDESGMKLWILFPSLALAALLTGSREPLKNAAHSGALPQPRVAESVPPPPAQRADRFGIYNWGIDYAAYPGDDGGAQDRLNWGTDQIAALGSRTAHLFLGARDIYYITRPDPYDLVSDASGPAYDKLFRDPRFKTWFLTTYTQNDMRSHWADGYTTEEYQAERDEIRRLGEYLIGNPNYAGRTFIILSWEGDNAMEGVANKQSAWDAYVRWIQSRADGIADARRANPANASRLFSGLEYNRVRSRFDQPCGTAVADPVREDPLRHRCVIDYVAPRVTVDYYLYSSFQTLIVKRANPEASLKDELNRDLAFSLARVRPLRPDVGEHNFIIGEFGFARFDYGECNAAKYVSELFDALEAPDAFKVSYAIAWQVMDDGPIWSGDLLGGYGLYRARNGKPDLTLAGKVFQARLAGENFTIPDNCPIIRQQPPGSGVLDSQTGTPDFHLTPDSVMAIYAQGCCQNTTTPFSATGNTVHFLQAFRDFLLPRDNPAFFYESPTQINASLPPGRHPGTALVYVTDQRGTDSNGHYLGLGCATCPAIRNECGILNATDSTDRLYPGAPVAIYGARFSAVGNRVTIEQLDNQQVTRSYTLPRDNDWTESADQITGRLPRELLTDRFAWLHVTDSAGRKSSQRLIFIGVDCQNCGPSLLPCGGLVNRVSQKADFRPGISIEIRGVNFSNTGNQVIVEQAGIRYPLPRNQAWTESATRITAALPATLQPGHAILYAIDSQGRETSARPLTITSTTVASVSAASYSQSALAPESIAAAFGTNLATTTLGATTFPLPASLAETTVIVKDRTGIERLAFLFFVSPTQVNYQLPPGLAAGLATVTITSGDGSVSTGPVQIAAVAPGLFSADASGSGLAAAIAVRVKPDNSQFTQSIARFDQTQNKFVAVPIDLDSEGDQVYLALFGTGFRFRSAEANVKARLGGIDLPVTYAGDQRHLIGLDQINVLLPRALVGKGDSVVEVTVDGKAANPVRVTIR
jgi:uncharacterized protein (TIGR03437 family)